MEAISNVASAASRVIFGESEPQDKDKKPKESGTEPVSGVTGAGTAEEPYDAGNEEGAFSYHLMLSCMFCFRADGSMNNRYQPSRHRNVHYPARPQSTTR